MIIALTRVKVNVRGQDYGQGLGSKRGRWDLDPSIDDSFLF